MNYGQPYGYQHGGGGYQPPKRGTGAGTFLLIVGGVLAAVAIVLGLVLAARHSGAKTSAASAVVDAGPSHAEAPWVAALVQLAANPKSVKSTATDDDGSGKPNKKDKNVNYEYSSPPGIPIKTLDLSVSKSNPAAWEFSFDEPERLTWDVLADAGRAVGPRGGAHFNDLAPSGAMSKLPPLGDYDVYEITGGPLNGAIIEHIARTNVVVMSLPYAIGEGDQWVCENRVPGARPFSSFEDQCRDMVRGKLLVPDSAEFPGLFDGQGLRQSTPGCGWRWTAWVKATNAFNVQIRHKFTCEDDPRTRAVSLTME